MEVLSEIVSLVHLFLVKTIFISVIIIGITAKVSKGKVDLYRALSVTSWILVGYAALCIVFYTADFLWGDHLKWFRSTLGGEYADLSIFKLIAPTIIPLFLLFKKLRKRFTTVFLVALIANFSWVMSFIVIGSVSAHRDFVKDSSGLWLLACLSLLVQGVLIAAFIITVTILLQNRAEKAALKATADTR